MINIITTTIIIIIRQKTRQGFPWGNKVQSSLDPRPQTIICLLFTLGSFNNHDGSATRTSKNKKFMSKTTTYSPNERERVSSKLFPIKDLLTRVWQTLKAGVFIYSFFVKGCSQTDKNHCF